MATRRPELLQRTLEAFHKYIAKGTPCRAIINIDPIGHDIPSEDVFELCQEYFDEVAGRLPNEPQMNDARKWLWEHCDSKYIFMLEEDWEFLRDYDLQRVIALMDAEPSLGGLGFTWQNTTLVHTNTPYGGANKYIAQWNGKYYKWRSQDRRAFGMTTMPGLLRGDLVRTIAPMFLTTTNVAMQLHGRRNKRVLEEILKYEYGLCGAPYEGPMFRDIGKEWMRQHGWKKDRNYAMTGWVRAES